MDDFSLIDIPQKLNKAPETDFYIATVTGVSSSGARLLFAGESSATSKYYKCLASANVSTGDRVVVMKQSGTYVVLGTIGGSGSNMIYTDVVSQILVPASGFTVNFARYAQYGKVAMLWFRFYVSTAITTTTTFKVCDMVSGKRPYMFAAPVLFWSSSQGYINPDGDLYVRGTASDTSSYYTVRAVYLVA